MRKIAIAAVIAAWAAPELAWAGDVPPPIVDDPKILAMELDARAKGLEDDIANASHAPEMRGYDTYRALAWFLSGPCELKGEESLNAYGPPSIAMETAKEPRGEFVLAVVGLLVRETFRQNEDPVERKAPSVACNVAMKLLRPGIKYSWSP